METAFCLHRTRNWLSELSPWTMCVLVSLEWQWWMALKCVRGVACVAIAGSANWVVSRMDSGDLMSSAVANPTWRQATWLVLFGELKFQFTLMANEHPKFEDDVPQFSGKINDHFVEWVTDVRLWEAERKGETKPRPGPRLHRRGLLGQPKETIKTLLGQGDLAGFTVENNIETFRNNGYGDTLEDKDQEALDNYFDMRQGEAEAIQDYINREHIMSPPLQNSITARDCRYPVHRDFPDLSLTEILHRRRWSESSRRSSRTSSLRLGTIVC